MRAHSDTSVVGVGFRMSVKANTRSRTVGTVEGKTRVNICNDIVKIVI